MRAIDGEQVHGKKPVSSGHLIAITYMNTQPLRQNTQDPCNLKPDQIRKWRGRVFSTQCHLYLGSYCQFLTIERESQSSLRLYIDPEKFVLFPMKGTCTRIFRLHKLVFLMKINKLYLVHREVG